MNTNLLENIREYLTPKILQHVSKSLGEDPNRTLRAVEGSIPTVLAGFVHFASLPNGPNQLLNLLENANYSRLLNNLSGLLDDGNTTQNVVNAGQEILKTVFVDKLSAVRELIRASSGVSEASASFLLNLVAPIVGGVLVRIRSAQGLDAAGLALVLMNQKYVLSRLAPSGLAGVFGVRRVADLGSGRAGIETAMEPPPMRRTIVTPVRNSRTSKQWLWSVFAAGMIGVLHLGQRGGDEVFPALPAKWVSGATSAGIVRAITLPDGTVLPLQEGSFNYNVAKFLGNSADSTIPKTFVFDRLHFDFDTTRLTPESMPTLTTLSVILRAYPTVSVRLDGHADGVGNVEDSKKLSLDRAVAVQGVLIKDGIDAARINAEGYGQEYPFTSDDTAEGRAKNQRLELVVLKK